MNFLTKSVDDHRDGYRVPLIIKLFRLIQSIIKQLHEEEEEEEGEEEEDDDDMYQNGHVLLCITES